MATNFIGYEKSVSAFPGCVEHRGSLKITMSEIRVVLRGSMFPLLTRYPDGSITLNAATHEEHSPRTLIRSDDGGGSWRPWPGSFPDFAGTNAFDLPGGKTRLLWYHTEPIAGQPGWFATNGWDTGDCGKTFQGPITNGRLFLPPEEFDPAKPQWFHGNIIAMPEGDLLAIMQGIDRSDQAFYPFHVYVARSEDGGRTWKYLSKVTSLATIDDPESRVIKNWILHGPCEPNIQHLGHGRLICVMRLVNDDRDVPLAAGTETYRDLSCTVSHEAIHPDAGATVPGRFYSLGPPSVPLIVSFSEDAGRSWSKAVPMVQARGCFPRMAKSNDILALTYGGLTFPRWGNCITFSLDGGRSWTDEMNFGPFLTTGYTDIVETGAGRFLCTFDCTPPQPWKNHPAHWVGVREIHVEKE